jgi:three-Cys-motif partner protein
VSPTDTVWDLDPHTRGKHLVLRNYLNAWFPILSSLRQRVLFIDGFAGPGHYKGGEEGSPLIATRASSIRGFRCGAHRRSSRR